MESQYIEDLTKVFETLNTLEDKVNKNKGKTVNIEQEEIMFGYSSDSTDSDVSFKAGTEEATSTYGNPEINTSYSERVERGFPERKRKKRGYFELDDDYESGYKHGYIRSRG